MDTGVLQNLGLSPSEIKVYIYLVNKGPGYANKISADTAINRTNVYEALDRLAAKGLVSQITKNKVKLFETQDPEHLMRLVEEKENEIKKMKTQVRKTVMELQKSVSKIKPRMDAGIFSGRKGLKSLFEDMLLEGKPLCFLAADLQFRYFFGPYFEQWHKKRASMGIEQKTIFPETVRHKVWPMKHWQRKFLPKEYSNPTTTIIYGDNCVFVQWIGEPLAIKILNPQIAKSHQNYFNVLWKIAKN